MTSESLRTTMAGLFLLSGLSATGAERSEDRLRAAAERAVATHPYLTAFDDVEVAVESGVVVLRGSVEQRHRREVVAANLLRLPGVRAVRNELAVQSRMASDAVLRRRLYERLYFGGFVSESATGWPVRIVVHEGRVTLVGSGLSSSWREGVERVAWNAGAAGVEFRQPAAALPPGVLAAAN